MGCDGYIFSEDVRVILHCYDCGEEIGEDVSKHFHGREWCDKPCVRFNIEIDDGELR